MVVNKENYQISHVTGESKVTIFKDGKVYKEVASSTKLSVNDLKKILELYQGE